MAGKKTLVGQLANAIIKRHPKAGSLTLAKMLRKESPAVFTSAEQARSAVRLVRGAKGAKIRKYATCPRSKDDAEQCRTWGALLPDPAKTPWKIETLPTGPKKWLVLADIHIPYHDNAAIVAALKFGREQKCDGVLLLGDVVDAYQLSYFCRDPRNRGPVDEIANVKQFLQTVKQALRPKAIVWRGANHEQRLERYLMQRAPELFPAIADCVSWRSLCGLDELGIQWIRWQNPIRVGKLTLLHGDEWSGGFYTPVNPARTAFLKSLECVVIGHLHRTSEHTTRTLLETTITCWSLGALCNLRPEYRPLNDWNHGCGILDLTGKQWQFSSRRIIEGEVL